MSARTLLLATLLGGVISSACSPAQGSLPRLKIVAVGDTAKIFVGWQAANRATGYLVSATVTATNGTWTGLPTDAPTSGTASVITATSAIADSARFTVCVKSTNGVTSSTATCSASAGWRRKLQPPGSVQIDSITLGLVPVASVEVTPATATLVLP